jgi:hypothetical protein
LAEPIEVGVEGGHRREPPAAGVLARDLERLGVKDRRQAHERRLDARDPHAVDRPDHRCPRLAVRDHDARPPTAHVGREHDLRFPSPKAFEPVDLTRRAAGRSGGVTRPQQRGANALPSRHRDRGHAIDVRMDAHENALTNQRAEPLTGDALALGHTSAEHASERLGEA